MGFLNGFVVRCPKYSLWFTLAGENPTFKHLRVKVSEGGGGANKGLLEQRGVVC